MKINKKYLNTNCLAELAIQGFNKAVAHSNHSESNEWRPYIFLISWSAEQLDSFVELLDKEGLADKLKECMPRDWEELDALLATLDAVEPHGTDEPAVAHADGKSPTKETITQGAAKPEEVESVRRSDYLFPAITSTPTNRIASNTTRELLDILDKLTRDKDITTGQRVPYARIRDWVCMINLELNRRGSPAPAFRPTRGVRYEKGQPISEEERLLSNDKQVAELHWLWTSSRSMITTQDRDFRALFSDDEFDFELASKLVCKKGAGSLKAAIMGLPDDLQFQLAIMVSNEIRNRRASIEKKERPNVERKIRARDGKVDVQDWGGLFVALRLAGGEIAGALKLYTLITSVKASRTRLSNRRTQLEDWLGIDREQWKEPGLLIIR